MNRNKNFIQNKLLTILIGIIGGLLLFSGCIKAPVKIAEDNKTEPVPEKPVQQQEKGAAADETEAMTVALKEVETQAAKFAEKQRQEVIRKKTKFADIRKQLSQFGYKPVKKPADLQALSECLSAMTKESLAYDEVSTAILPVKKAQALFLIGKKKDALETLTKDYPKVILSDAGLKKSGLLHLSPAAEAAYLQGEIYLDLARNQPEANKAKDLYINAVKAFYTVLGNYDANQCPFSAPAVTGFTECRREIEKKFNVKVGFPPEF